MELTIEKEKRLEREYVKRVHKHTKNASVLKYSRQAKVLTGLNCRSYPVQHKPIKSLSQKWVIETDTFFICAHTLKGLKAMLAVVTSLEIAHKLAGKGWKDKEYLRYPAIKSFRCTNCNLVSSVSFLGNCKQCNSPKLAIKFEEFDLLNV